MSTSQLVTHVKQAAFGGLILLLSSLSAQAAVSPQLTPEPVHSQVIRDIASSLVDDHYSDIDVDDSLSSKVLDSFVDNLDPSKAYFSRTISKASNPTAPCLMTRLKPAIWMQALKFLTAISNASPNV